MAKEKEKETTEQLPLILEGAWVKLAATKNVPEEYQGMLANVMSCQIFEGDGSEVDAISPRPYRYQTPDAKFLVRTRGHVAATLEVTRADFAEWSQQGRNELEGHG